MISLRAVKRLGRLLCCIKNRRGGGRFRPRPPEFKANRSRLALSFLGFPRATRGPGRFYEALQHLLEYIDTSWGSGRSLAFFAPSMVGNAAFEEWWGRFERLGATPADAIALMRTNSQIDISSILPAIHVPTLVIHRTDQKSRPVLGRVLATVLVMDAGHGHGLARSVAHNAAVNQEFARFRGHQVRPVGDQWSPCSTALRGRLRVQLQSSRPCGGSGQRRESGKARATSAHFHFPALIDKLAKLRPDLLACMHDSAWSGDGASQQRKLGQSLAS